MNLVPVGTYKIGHFDIETRRVGFFSAGKFSPDGCEPIAIAISWSDSPKVEVKLLGECESEELLTFFADFYAQADIVTGHYIRKFDLPILAGAMLEHQLPHLPPKLSSDTHKDLTRRAGLSASQENLAAMYELSASKEPVSDHAWRNAARLDPEAMKKVRKRVVMDVKQHKQLRERLIEANALKPPRVWSA